uniref:Secreted protein n=1 Tax=Megaselia scalaris TaxID=36166 RepID=T1GTA8_MEGSC
MVILIVNILIILILCIEFRTIPCSNQSRPRKGTINKTHKTDMQKVLEKSSSPPLKRSDGQEKRMLRIEPDINATTSGVTLRNMILV